MVKVASALLLGRCGVRMEAVGIYRIYEVEGLGIARGRVAKETVLNQAHVSGDEDH